MLAASYFLIMWFEPFIEYYTINAYSLNSLPRNQKLDGFQRFQCIAMVIVFVFGFVSISFSNSNGPGFDDNENFEFDFD